MNKKRVLFLGVGLYNYDSLILDALSKLYDVSYVYLFPIKKKKFLYRFLSHTNNNKEIQTTNSRLLFESIKKAMTCEYDYVFAVKGSRLEQCHFDYINKKSPRAQKILYLWDAWELIENKTTLLKNFNKIYSFDSEDCRKYGFVLRPLFYNINDNKKENRIFDVSFIGTEHSNRLERLREIKEICKEEGYNYFFRLKTTYLPVLKSILGLRPYKRDDIDIVSFKPLNYDEVLSITRRTKCVLDLVHPSQCGLTMRTLETFALGCKLITTNKYLNEYEDLDPSWYYIIDNELNLKEICSFISTPCKPINIPYKYSLDSFINELIH